MENQSSSLIKNWALKKTSLIIAVLLLIVLWEYFCYWPLIKQAGFYLDDWVMLYKLEFAPKDLWGAMASFFFEPRVIVRPVEVPYFVLLHQWFGLTPHGYHVVNMIFEALSGFLLFLILFELSGSRSAAFGPAILFLLSPNRDCLHYWVLASSVTFSLFLYLLSLWLTIRAVESGRRTTYLIATICFALSLFNYESLMPLLVINIACTLLLAKAGSEKNALSLPQPRQWIRTAKLTGAFVLTIAVFAFYNRYIAPSLGDAVRHPVSFNIGRILDIIKLGVLLNTPWQAFSFFMAQAQAALAEGPLKGIASLISMLSLSALALAYCAWLDDQKPQAAKISALMLVAVGTLSLIASYSIFGLNNEYLPSYATNINRINAGAAVALALISSGILLALGNWFDRIQYRLPAVAIINIVLILPICLLFFLADQGFSRYWIQSWTVQSQVFRRLQLTKDQYNKDNFYLLADCPRYLFWSSVLDGIWDFQSMLRIATGYHDIQGDVVSDRMQLTRSEFKDISMNVTCAKAPYSNIYMIVCPQCNLVYVGNASKFMELLEQHGLRFEPDKTLLEKWRAQLAK